MNLTGHDLMVELDRQSRMAREARDFERRNVLDDTVQIVKPRVIGVPLADVQVRVASWLEARARDARYTASVRECWRETAEFVKNFG